MVAYNFQRRFVHLIRAGLKTQTIRNDRNRDTRPGELMQLYTAMRTARCERIIPNPLCKSVLPIRLVFGHDALMEVEIAGEQFLDVEAFAQSDGFSDARDMAAFWRAQHPPIYRYSGVIIGWEPPL